jgi:glucokinase
VILAGDVGGTNTRLALFEMNRGAKRSAKRGTRLGRLVMRARAEFKNANRRDLASIVREFLDPLPHRARVACFGVAGPVKNGRALITNLGWTIDQRKLGKSLGIPKLALINDLVAHAEGSNVLGPRDALTLHQGKPIKGGGRAVLAPGTGLGEAGLVYDHPTRDYRAVPSEGGHCDFAPKDQRTIALLEHMFRETGRCSWEDLVSGPGLRRIWDFLTAPGEFQIAPSHAGDSPTPAQITSAAVDGSCRACVGAVELFVVLMGHAAGNLALKFLATGGVYLGGGIPPHIVTFLQQPSLRSAFTNKGPEEVHAILRDIPIRLITSPNNALRGAAHYAQRIAG